MNENEGKKRWKRLLQLPFLLILVGFLIAHGCSREGKPGKEGKALEGMVLVPAGEFLMGTDKTKEAVIPAAFGLRKPAYEDERPIRKVPVKAFYIDQFEVNVAQYRKFVEAPRHKPTSSWLRKAWEWVFGEKFVEAPHHKPPAYWQGQDLEHIASYPVVGISWHDAQAYCQWAGKRLPTEMEWEKAARGADGRRFPWGNEYDANKANMSQKGLSPVGWFQGDASPFGVYDMAGNVCEWVADWYRPYPGNTDKDPDFGERFKVIRGGSWGGVGHYNISFYARCAYRSFSDPNLFYNDAGFRCAQTP